MGNAKQRIQALDILRGITVAAMIVVNNGASSKVSYAQLLHSEWNGLTLCDMVFPSFLFIVGISTYLSLGKQQGWTRPLAYKIFKRTLLIALIGWALHWFGHLLEGDIFPIGTFRLTGVLPRIAVCYCLASVAVVSLRRNLLWWLVAALLVLYGALLLCGNGLVNGADNVIARVDRLVLGAGHIYAKRPIDPEGLVSNIGALAHTLVGVCVGMTLLRKDLSIEGKLLTIMAVGFGLLLLGICAEAVIPVNKRIWSPSFVLVTCGLVALALGAVSYLVDVRHRGGWLRVFSIYGVNPLFLYVLSELASEVMSFTGAKTAAYECILSAVGHPQLSSAIYALFFSAVFCAIGYPLFKRKIYIKI